MDNILKISELNPVLFFNKARATSAKYHTKFFDTFMFKERLYRWQLRTDYKQVWQKTDIIYLQFSSNFDPVTVSVIDHYGITRLNLAALVGLPDKNNPGSYAYEVAISLADLDTGCYKIEIRAGIGEDATVMESDTQVVCESLPDTVLLEYYNSHYHNDVIFETGIKFQFRIPATFGFLQKARSSEVYRDQKYNPTLLSSRSAKQWPVNFGDQYGLPDDIINLIDEIWGCDHVSIDTKPFSAADGSKLEFVEADRYAKRGVKLTVEEGINRNSRLFGFAGNPEKKLITSVIVEGKVFGDTGNQGSNNVVPIYNVYE